jgi:hypothetical protein
VSVVIYALNAAVASLLLITISWYATSRHRLVVYELDEEEEEEEEEEERVRRLQGLAVPVVFLLSKGVSFLSPMAAAMYSSWLLLSVTDPLVRRLRSR